MVKKLKIIYEDKKIIVVSKDYLLEQVKKEIKLYIMKLRNM